MFNRAERQRNRQPDLFKCDIPCFLFWQPDWKFVGCCHCRHVMICCKCLVIWSLRKMLKMTATKDENIIGIIR